MIPRTEDSARRAAPAHLQQPTIEQVTAACYPSLARRAASWLAWYALDVTAGLVAALALALAGAHPLLIAAGACFGFGAFPSEPLARVWVRYADWRARRAGQPQSGAAAPVHRTAHTTVQEAA